MITNNAFRNYDVYILNFTTIVAVPYTERKTQLLMNIYVRTTVKF